MCSKQYVTYKGRSVSRGSAHGTVCTPHCLKQEGIALIPDMCIDNFAVVSKSLGVIAKAGSCCSHLASICREFGIPAVILDEPSSELKEGVDAIVNADNGEVYVLTKS